MKRIIITALIIIACASVLAYNMILTISHSEIVRLESANDLELDSAFIKERVQNDSDWLHFNVK